MTLNTQTKLLRKFCIDKDIKQVLIVSYNPNSNGISKRIMITMGNKLRCSFGSSILEIVGKIETSINLSYNTTIGCYPTELVKEIISFDEHKLQCNKEKTELRRKFRRVWKRTKITRIKPNKT